MMHEIVRAQYSLVSIVDAFNQPKHFRQFETELSDELC